MLLDCLIVQQPYASLIAFGKKRWELRSYETKKEGLIGIAASPSHDMRTRNAQLNYISPSFPKGVVLATAELITSFYVTSEDLKVSITEPVKTTIHGHELFLHGEPLGEPVEDVQHAIDDKKWNSYAWLLENVKPLKEYVKFERTGMSPWIQVEVPTE